MVLQAIRYSRGSLEVIDQLKLPHEQIYFRVDNPEAGWNAIQSMRVRGAPAIAIVAALSLAVYLHQVDANDIPLLDASSDKYANFIIKSLKYLVTSRPTAVNLADAARKLERLVYVAQTQSGSTVPNIRKTYIEAAEKMLLDDVQDNKNIGKYGAEWIATHAGSSGSTPDMSIVTHCNTGSLATAGYGTALGVIRSVHGNGKLRRAYYTETRPYNQGSRLTGFELIHDNIPSLLITDSMLASLLRLKKDSENIACVVVGADRVAANGDTANKIGTYSLAILARYHGVKFLVAAPRTTIDLSTSSGSDIIVEERPQVEVTALRGPCLIQQSDQETKIDVSDVHEISIAAAGTQAWNPAFDVTPASLIDAIVTEKGVVEKGSDGTFDFDAIFDQHGEIGHSANLESFPNASLHETEPVGIPDNGLSWAKVFSLRPNQIPSWESWMQSDNLGQT